MKWFIRVLPIIIAAIFFTGCIEMQTKIKLNKDGSGSVEENIFIGKAIINMLKEFAAAFADSTQPQQEFNFFEEEKIRSKAYEFGEDVVLTSFEMIKTEEKEGYKAIYKFSDINKVVVNQDPSHEMPVPDASNKPKEYLQFKFVKGKPSRIEFTFPKEEKKSDEKKSDEIVQSEEADAETDSTNLAQMSEFMKDMKARIEIEVAGKIVGTNASHVENNVVTLFDIDFGKLISDKDKWEKFQKLNPDTFEEAKGLLSEIPGFKIELNKSVYIDFE